MVCLFYYFILIPELWIVYNFNSFCKRSLHLLSTFSLRYALFVLFSHPSPAKNYFNATVILIYTRLTLANDKSVPPERRRRRRKNIQTTKVASVVIDWNKSHFVFSQMTRGRVILGIFYFFFWLPSPIPLPRRLPF